MFKQNKLKIILSSVIILLPVFFGIIMWNDLPNTVATHWGADGNADGFNGKAFAVFGLPCILLVSHFVCLLFTLLDKKQKAQNPKALGMVFWILPTVSLLINAMIYHAALSNEIKLIPFLPILPSAMFMLMGNYLPKVKQNSTLGIRTVWTLHNEDNWNRTHRFAGKVWFAGGLILLCSIFFSVEVMAGIMIATIVGIAILPCAYSYRIYRQHQKDGITYDAPPKSRAEKLAGQITAAISGVLLIGIAVLMLTGDIEVRCNDTSFEIHATYWTDAEIDYSQVDGAEYRKDLDLGIRTNGFASARLSLGIFQNDEFDLYTLYSYAGAKEFVVLSSGGETLVIGMTDPKDTQAIYETISSKISG